MAPPLLPPRHPAAPAVARGLSLALVVLAIAPAARAQTPPTPSPPAAPAAAAAVPEAPAAPPPAPVAPSPAPPPPAAVAPPLPPPPPPPPAAPPKSVAPESAGPVQSDHDGVVHHIAVGYYGISQLPVGVQTGGTASGTVDAPVVGVRYWATRALGIDLGVGFGYSSAGSSTTGGVHSTSDSWGVAFHAGLPLSLASSRHFSFEIVPIEGTFGFAGGSTPNPGGPGTPATVSSLSGFRMDVGGRIGAELQFGFIGIPQLALEGSIGLYVQHEDYASTTNPEMGAPAGTGSTNSTKTSGNTTSIATSVGSDPWAIFTDTISALYYF